MGEHVKNRPISFFVGAAAAFYLAANAPAAADQAESTGGDDRLQEIVVTAQRRSENVQTVPIAITALEGADLEGKAIESVADLQFASPSISIGNNGVTNAVNIRGVGLASGLSNVSNGVATYVDGLFQPQIVTNNRFYDIADVEILRGPQGTLVGSNSTGGALFINTQNPKIGRNEGHVNLGAGDYGRTDAEGAVNLPINDVLAFRIAGDYISRDSFYNSVGPVHTDAGKLDERSGRVGILFKPGAFEALAKVEFTDRDTGGYTGTAIPSTAYAAFAPKDPFTLSYDTPTFNHETALSIPLELRYELSNGITIRSVSGYQNKRAHNLQDYDFSAENTPLNPRLTWDSRIREREYSEEINILSPSANSYDWVLGYYYQKNKVDVNIDEGGATGPGGPPLFIFEPANKTTSGVFGQVNVRFSPQWELGIGLRYSSFKTDGDGFVAVNVPAPVCSFIGLSAAPFNGCRVASLSGSESDGRPTGKVSLSYTPSKNNTLYAFAARGYKAGGFTSPTANFAPETVLDLELGWKASLADDHVRTQLDGFHYSYHDFQFQNINLTNGSLSVRNLPTATIYGAEATIQAHTGGLRLDAGAGYVHSSLPSAGSIVNTHLMPPGLVGTAGPQCAPGQTAGCFDYTPYLTTNSGGPNLYSPQWTFNVGVAYRFAVSDQVTVTPRVNYAYMDRQFVDLTYSRTTDYLPAHGLISALLTCRIYDHWSAELYGTNLSNKVYPIGQVLTSNNYFTYGHPRQYGARVGYTF